MRILNKKKPYAIVSGHVGALYEQDGALFDGAGREVNDAGDLVVMEEKEEEELRELLSGSPPETEGEARDRLSKLSKKQLIDLMVRGLPLEVPSREVPREEAEEEAPSPVQDDMNALKAKFEVTDADGE